MADDSGPLSALSREVGVATEILLTKAIRRGANRT
jgi:hypothetical protein